MSSFSLIDLFQRSKILSIPFLTLETDDIQVFYIVSNFWLKIYNNFIMITLNVNCQNRNKEKGRERERGKNDNKWENEY